MIRPFTRHRLPKLVSPCPAFARAIACRSALLIFLLIFGLPGAPPLLSQQAPPQPGATPATTPQPPMTKQSTGGMANAGPQKAQFDSQHRPITAGGFVKTGPIVFQDVAAAAGLTTLAPHGRHPKSASFSKPKAPASACWTMTTTAGSISIL